MLSSFEYINFVLPFNLTHQFGCIPSSAVELFNAPAGCGVVVLLPGNVELSSSSTVSYGPWKSARVAFLLTGSYVGGIGMTSGWSCPDSDTQNAQFHSCQLQPHNNSESSCFPCYIIMKNSRLYNHASHNANMFNEVTRVVLS